MKTPRIRERVIAIIPARSGSKGVPHKNIRSFAGKPLLAWSIEQALAARTVSRVIVSTDSPDYARIARDHGAEAPFIRPRSISGDDSTDVEVFRHALLWLKKREGSVPDLCVHLRPTCPRRRPGLIDDAVRMLREHPGADSVRTVAPSAHTPYKMWRRDPAGRLQPLLALRGLKDPWNQPRQRLPAVFVQTANVDVVRSSCILRKRSMTGDHILGYLDDAFVDIDTEADFREAEQEVVLESILRCGRGDRTDSPKTFCFDLDGVLATTVPGNDYRRSRPRRAIIKLVNALHASGHTILIHTARGSATGMDWRAVTRGQLRRWRVRHDALAFGKPAADYYVDDKGVALAVVEHAARLLDEGRR